MNNIFKQPTDSTFRCLLPAPFRNGSGAATDQVGSTDSLYVPDVGHLQISPLTYRQYGSERRLLNLSNLGVHVQFVDTIDIVDCDDGNKKSAPSKREIRITPDWSEHALSVDHMWAPTAASGDFCCLTDANCTKSGTRMKCPACKIIAHSSCIPLVYFNEKMACKPSFRDVGIRQYREQTQTQTQHHWVHRRTAKGKCKQCFKSLQSKLFGSKEICALTCAWCKDSYHNKETCFNAQRIGEECRLGEHANIMVPPSWIVKLPQKGNFKSSLRKSPKKKKASAKKSKEKDSKTFIVKAIPNAEITPVLVFINPKSGGNQGVKLLAKFQWLLNPRQVFDLTQGGPNFGLELFRKCPQLRILACGGDGTVGWVLSVLDQLQIVPQPPVGTLPLGTGNDLARALGWGGGYEDEPIGKILRDVGQSDTILLDRWLLKVEPNPDGEDKKGKGKENLPLNVVNNYFSFGVDAHIALEFHEAREAHPEKFNSRLRNKMFYGQAGGKDLLQRKWKALADFVKIECDGQDFTPKLKEHRVHAIVFLNIPSYGGGTHPWNNSGGSVKPATDDGLIEVVGLTTFQLPLLQAGGHGTCITQCKSARIVTSKTIPMQVDGEACRLKPSIIELSLLNQSIMLAKKKPGRPNVQLTAFEPVSFNLLKITMREYEQHHYDKDHLKESAISFGKIEVNPVSDLENLRNIINKHCDEMSDCPRLSNEWCFLDACTADRFFRIDRAQENLHYVTDIANDAIFVLNQEFPTHPHSPSDDHTLVSPGSLADSNEKLDEPNKHQQRYHAEQTEKSSKSSAPALPRTPAPKSNPPHSPAPPIPQEIRRGSTNPSPLPYNNSTTTESSSPMGHLTPNDSSTDANERMAYRGYDELRRNTSGNIALPRLLGNGHNIDFKSASERLFSLNEDAFGISSLLEKTTDVVLKAAKAGDFILLKNLHAEGYSLMSIDSTGQTALHYASRYGHKDIVKYLIAFAPGCIINMVDNIKGQTALHKAASNCQRNICYMLVAAGANLAILDNDGQTPMMLAFAANDHELASYLQSQTKFQRLGITSEQMLNVGKLDE